MRWVRDLAESAWPFRSVVRAVANHTTTLEYCDLGPLPRGWRVVGRGWRAGEGDRAAAVARRCWAPLSGGEGPGNEGIWKWMCAGFVEKGLPSCCPLPKLPIANWDCRRAKLAPNVSAVRVPTVDSDLSHVSSHSHHGNEQPPKCHSQGHGDIKDQHLRGGEGDGWDRARRGKREKAHLDSSETS